MSQEVETLTVHSLFTIQSTEAVKKILRNVRKRWVFAQWVTYTNETLITVDYFICNLQNCLTLIIS